MYTYDENLFSDLHKDAFGFRPSEYAWAEWNEASPAQKQVIWEDLLDGLDRAVNEEKLQQEAAVASFESRIASLMLVGARDRETAIRWIVESLNLSENDKMYGGSYICFELGLPYSMAAIFEPFLKINA